MNTARQLLWLPTTREEKYKAKQAIDTFFVRGGDVLSAAAVLCRHGHPSPERPAVRRSINIVAHAGLAGDCDADRPSAVDAAARADASGWPPPRRGRRRPRHRARRRRAQETREGAAGGAHAPTRRRAFTNTSRRRSRGSDSDRPEPALSPAAGLPVHRQQCSTAAVSRSGPAIARASATSARFDAHAAWSVRNYKAARRDAAVCRCSPTAAFESQAERDWLTRRRSPSTASATTRTERQRPDSHYARRRTIGASARHPGGSASVGGRRRRDADDRIADRAATDVESRPIGASRAFAELDSADVRRHTRRGGLYRVDWSDLPRDQRRDACSFRRIDAEVQRFIPILRENWVDRAPRARLDDRRAPGQ